VALVEPKALLADKGYGADRFVESLKVRAIKPVIPPKSNRKIKRDCDFALNAERNLVERFFNTIKHFRAIATRRRRTRTVNIIRHDLHGEWNYTISPKAKSLQQ
jgi:transposase